MIGRVSIGARSLEARGVLAIKGVSWMMFHVLVPLGIGTLKTIQHLRFPIAFPSLFQLSVF